MGRVPGSRCGPGPFGSRPASARASSARRPAASPARRAGARTPAAALAGSQGWIRKYRQDQLTDFFAHRRSRPAGLRMANVRPGQSDGGQDPAWAQRCSRRGSASSTGMWCRTVIEMVASYRDAGGGLRRTSATMQMTLAGTGRPAFSIMTGDRHERLRVPRAWPAPRRRPRRRGRHRELALCGIPAKVIIGSAASQRSTATHTDLSS
jgi:hypothetical protein